LSEHHQGQCFVSAPVRITVPPLSAIAENDSVIVSVELTKTSLQTELVSGKPLATPQKEKEKTTGEHHDRAHGDAYRGRAVLRRGKRPGAAGGPAPGRSSRRDAQGGSGHPARRQNESVLDDFPFSVRHTS